MDVATAQSVSRRSNQPLDEILNLPVGEEYLFRRGSAPVRTTRYDVSTNRHYPELSALKQRMKSRVQNVENGRNSEDREDRKNREHGEQRKNRRDSAPIDRVWEDFV